MADVKKTGGGDEDIFSQTLGLIIIVFIILSVLSNYGFNFLSTDDSQVEGQPQKTFSLSSAFPVGEIKLGNDVINKKDVDVYRTPGRNIVGFQSKREVAKPIEGPAKINGANWWRLDYKNAPDGWVREASLTDYVWGYRTINFFPIVFGTLTPFLFLLSIVLFVLIIVVMVKTNNLYDIKQKKLEFQKNRTVKDKIVEESEKEDSDNEEADEKDSLFGMLPTDDNAPQTQDVSNKRWAQVQNLINSHSVNDWKQAIIEADIILDEMLEKMGYKGNSIGDKLKKIEESDFLTLNQAWEAHKIRNRIAHKGSNYTLTRGDAERAFNLYKEVFEEFYFI